ncbi:MAG: ribonuclease HI [Epsilonproteobacteria bacterium]|nr:ribonuclease HI [Campylobacterota bacterium]
MKHIEIFTDGSCLGNPGRGGWCAILRYNQHQKILKGCQINTTNNRMELLAVIKALEALKEPCEIELYSDSTYVLRGINEWLDNWKRKNFKKVKNVDLWKRYLDAAKHHVIHINWIRGHSGHTENELCDSIARAQAQDCTKDLNV